MAHFFHTIPGNMDPTTWGPACWRLVFTASFRLPHTRCVQMFDALRYVLPCVHCRRSYRMYLQRMPPGAAIDGSKHSAAKFAWTVKDYVNGKVGAGPLPFSALCDRHEVFSSPVSRMDIADLLCCVAMQVDEADQVTAYETFASVMEDLATACGEKMQHHLPLDAKFRSPATLWLHAMKVKNGVSADVGQTALTRDDVMRRYRREPKAARPEPRSRSARSSRR